MIGLYIRGYLQRKANILISLVICIFSVLLPSILFYGKITSISDQLSSYASADYSRIYVLNYEADLNNICVYPDTDIAIYLDSERERRLTVSGLMSYPGSCYDLHITKSMKKLGSREIILTQNVAVKYGISENDTLYIVYPYSDDIFPISVRGIEETNYDFTNPVIDNDIGIVYLGPDEKYIENVQSKYILFSASSKSSELSNYPQIINFIISMDKNQRIIYSQGINILIWDFVFSLSGVILIHFLFFRKSRRIIHRMFIKGNSRRSLTTLLLTEKIVLCVIPCLLAALFNRFRFCQVIYTNALFFVSLSSSVIYCITSTVYISIRSIHRKGL